MKKVIITVLIALVYTTSNATDSDQCIVKNTVSNSSALNKKELALPYSDTGSAEMKLVAQQGTYTLWKCPVQYVVNYPLLSSIVGKTYHYFVYNNNDFHLTVNNMNKQDVYKFFTGLKESDNVISQNF